MSFKGIEESLVKVIGETFSNRKVSYSFSPEGLVEEIDVIFDNAVIDELGVTSTYPAITVDSKKLLRFPSTRDKVTIDGTEYRILDVRPDGIGGLFIKLSK